MRQRLTIILTFVVIIGLLVIINSLTYVQDDQLGETEVYANRSTYHSGPTGTRALHDFLSESGYKVMRWREPTAQLLGNAGQMVSTFVMIGPTRVEVEEEERQLLSEWVNRGGRLIVIDRSLETDIVPTNTWAGGWTISTRTLVFPNLDTDPGDVAKMTENVTEFRPAQPTLLTSNIEAVMPSRFAARFLITPKPRPSPPPVPINDSGGVGIGPGVVVEPTPWEEEAVPEETPSPEASPTVAVPVEGATDRESEAAGSDETEEEEAHEDEATSEAPVVHFGDKDGALVLDYAYGYGRVVIMSDPYILTNSGLHLKDNLTLAINMLGGPNNQGLIAFDEFHQGRGVSRNAFAAYFAGTPVLAIAGQIVLLVLVVLWSNGRRFGRPLPLPQVDRRSSLEFVASMAELQERSRAFDLAIENIYSRIRRVLARHAGIDYNSSRAEIAERIASRSTIDRHELETLMKQCEDAINGEPITWRQSIQLVRRLRELERNLGLRMRSRDVRQAAEKI